VCGALLQASGSGVAKCTWVKVTPPPAPDHSPFNILEVVLATGGAFVLIAVLCACRVVIAKQRGYDDGASTADRTPLLRRGFSSTSSAGYGRSALTPKSPLQEGFDDLVASRGYVPSHLRASSANPLQRTMSLT